MPSVRPAVRTDVAWCAAVFAGASIVFAAITWPLLLTFGTEIPHDLGDPILNTLILWWNAVHVPLTDAWWNAPMFFPATGVMAFSEHLLGLSVFASPIIWISRNPVLAYNVMLLLTFALSAVAAFLLVHALTGRRDAAVIAAALFAFAPYRLGQLSHLQVLVSYWMPIGLLGLHKFLETGRTRWLVTFAVAWLLQSLSNGYYAVFFSVLVVVWITWFARAGSFRRLVALALAWTAVAACFAPILLKYRAIHDTYGLVRNFGDVQSFSADVASLLQAPSLSAVWDKLKVFQRNEADLFPGATAPLVLLVCGVLVFVALRGTRPFIAAIRRRSATLFYPIAAMVMFIFALGPTPTYLGTEFLSTSPYAWLMALPGAAALRVPARFFMLVVLCLAIGAALTYARASGAWSRARRVLVTAVIVLAAVAETWTKPIPLLNPPRDWDVQAGEIRGALLVLPVLNVYNDIAHVYRARLHGRPVVNGYSGHFPPWYRTLKDGLNALDPLVLDELAAVGVTQIAIVKRNDTDGTWQRFVETRATHVRDSADGAFSLFDLPSVPSRRPAPGRRVPIARVIANVTVDRVNLMLDGDESSYWMTSERQRGDEVVTIELAGTQTIDAIDFSLGPRREFDYPRRLVIEVSDDGAAWRAAWQGDTVATAVAGAFRDPARVSLRFEFEPTPARFVRLRQTSRTRAAFWAMAELAVLAR